MDGTIVCMICWREYRTVAGVNKHQSTVHPSKVISLDVQVYETKKGPSISLDSIAAAVEAAGARTWGLRLLYATRDSGLVT